MKKSLLALFAITLSASASANWVGGVSYSNLSQDEDGLDVSLNALVATIGYENAVNDNFIITPQFRYGFGVDDDKVDVFGTEVKVELESLMSFDVRGQYEFNNNLYVFAQPSYANVDLKASANGNSASEDEWEFGVGAGIGYLFNDTTSAEVSFESFDGADVFGIGLRMKF